MQVAGQSGSADVGLSDQQKGHFVGKGGNATVFVHGYNVPEGHLPKMIDSVKVIEELSPHHASSTRDTTKSAKITYTDMDCTFLRNREMLKRQFPALAEAGVVLPDALQHDEGLNGTGACNWVLHMEDNLNRAAGQFDYTDYTKYSRIVGVSWSGDPQSPADYMSIMPRIQPTAERMAKVLMQLVKEDMIVNVIAHSLGCAVVLHALELLAKTGCRHVIHHVFLWQPAVPDHALSSDKEKPAPEDPDYDWYLPQAAEAAYKISVLHSFNDNILGPIPKGQLNQRQINADKPLEELVPALILTKLDLGSIYSLAMWCGVPVSDLLSCNNQAQIYEVWRRRLKSKRLPVTFAEQIQRSRKSYKAMYRSVYERLMDQRNEILDEIKAAKGHVPLPWYKEQAIRHPWLLDLFLDPPRSSVTPAGAPIPHVEPHHSLNDAEFTLARLLELGGFKVDNVEQTVQGLLTLINTIFVEGEYWPPKAMGYYGVKDSGDSSVQSLITAGKLYDRNQTLWLWSHSGMKIPSEALMDHVYKRWIATKQGLGVFGPFELPDRGDA